MTSLLAEFIIFAYFLRGPGGRGPWPGPNTNSVSHVFNLLNCFYQQIEFIIAPETLEINMDCHVF